MGSSNNGDSQEDGRIRTVSDFLALNKCIKQKIYPLPNIIKLLQKRPGYEFLTKLDISILYFQA